MRSGGNRRLRGPARALLIAASSAATAMFPACGPSETPPARSLGGAPPPDSVAVEAPLRGEVSFDREITFLSLDQDSTLVVPWIFGARVADDAVYREQRVLLSRGGAWEDLSRESVITPPTRTPWRIIPGSETGLVVGPGDRVEALLLRAAPGELELTLGDLLAEWPRPGEESVGLLEARALFPAGTVDGLVLDISRRWAVGADGAGEPGDWLFLHSGPQLQVFLEETGPLGPSRSPAPYQGWTRLAFRDLRWDEIVVDWPEARPFEEARRDVPVRWRLSAPGGGLSGELEVVSSWIEVGTGQGPILPLDAFFQVRGEVEVQEEAFAVVGVVRHVQR